MHEMSLCQGMVQIIEEQAKAHAYVRVKTVRLEIGPLAAVEPEALRFCFDAASSRSSPPQRPPGASPAEKPLQYQSATESAPTAAAIKCR